MRGLANLALSFYEHSLDILKKKCVYGYEPQLSRCSAILSLANLCSQFYSDNKKVLFECEEIFISIVSFLDNSNFNYFVRRSAVEALLRLESKRSISILEGSYSNFVNQDHPWLTKMIKKIKNSSNDEKKEFDYQINLLKERLIFLEKKIPN